MAVIVGEAAVRLRPETSKFADEAERDIDRKLPGVAGKAAGFFAAAFAAVGVGAFLANAVSQATDLGENMSKVGVVFGDSAKQIEDFASTASTALGQSENQALEAAGTFGSLFVGMGIGQQQAADMSTSMVTLASDMASFGNATPQEALDALRAGLIGEAEPLRRFGVMLDAAKIEAEAMRLGLAGANGELTEAAKAQAVYSLAMQQTALQQGDFGRTSEGLANQQRIIRAQFTDLSTDVGGLFVPALANAAQGISGRLMPALLGATDGLPALGDALGGLGDVFRAGFDDGLDSAFAMIEGTDGVARAVGLVAANAGDLSAIFREAFADGAAGSALLGQAGIEGFVVTLGHVGAQVRDAVLPAFDTLRDAVGPALAQVTGAFGAAFGGGGGGGGILGAIAPLLEQVGPLLADYIGRWAEVFAVAIPIIADVLSALAPVISGLIAQVGPILTALLPIISEVAGLVATALVTALTALGPVIPPLAAAIGEVAQVLAGAFLGVLSALLPVLPVLVQVLAQVAGMVAGALAGAIQALVPILPPLVTAFAQIAQVLVGAVMAALTALLPIIPELVGVFVLLINSAVVPLLPVLPLLANLVATVIAALAPLIPVVIQVAVMLIRLAVAAIIPLMPVVLILANLITMLIGAIVPIIQVLVAVAGGFIGMAATVAGVVIGVVSFVLTTWTRLISGIAGIYGAIFSVIRGVWTSIASWVSGAVSGIASTISRVFSGVAGAISGVFSGVADTVGGVFDSVVSGVRRAINAVIGVINGAIRTINSTLIANINELPGVDLPPIPSIPRLHSGGVFHSDDGTGEGLALLRDDELVATPEQRRVADNLLRALLDGTLPTPAPAGPGGTGGVVVEQHITQLPGESGASLAARVTQGVVWNLNLGITRPVSAGS